MPKGSTNLDEDTEQTTFAAFEDTYDEADAVVKRIPNGTYTAAVKAVERKVSENSGFPYYWWTFELLDDDEELNGSHIGMTASLAPKALPMTIPTLNILGVKASGGKISFSPEDVYDRVVRIKIATRERDGVTRTDVTGVYPASDSASRGAAKRNRPF